ncbi:MAG: hypothetical protein QOJ79_936 [Actinomycetota bacterium]|jgi:oxygen-independent coproporphyrinogen-3 oxidase|nr:hypothetical protein [Actinomycetota bacterium]
MAGALPQGEPVPTSGELPAAALAELADRPFGVYVHVPFCASRCGYCDFNTYTDLGGLQSTFAQTAIRELQLARNVLGQAAPRAETVFVGGGTPTLLPPDDLGAIVQAVDDVFGLAPGAEVTTEANPDSVDAGSLQRLREVGFNRVSFGMQSSVPHVLAALDRTHTAGRPELAVREAREAGFEQISLDLIYGTPGESDDDWRTSLETALAAGPTHVSAYALIVEQGTRLGRQVARGELPGPDDDVLADRYLIANDFLSDLGWYEVSNWGDPCRHNVGYWTGANWWGIGPGAHSHVGGVRWWNVKHPAAYARKLETGTSPGAGREVLSAEDRRVERILLELRLRTGLPLALLTERGRQGAAQHREAGLLTVEDDRAVLTTRGRLLADAVVRDLVDP